MTILTLMMTVMLLGFGALVVDIGRLYNLHSQMQSYVDQVALAAAAELDGEADAIERARAALGDKVVDPPIDPIVIDFQNFAVGDAELAIEAPDFYSQLPADNALSTAAYEEALAKFWVDPADPDQVPLARFVRIRAKQRTMNFFLMPLVALIGSYFGENNVATTAHAEAQAIAGFKREVCDNTPLMICNPYEAISPGADFASHVVRGQQIRAKMKGGGESWAPGTFGLLDALTGQGASDIRDSMARVHPNTSCIGATAGVDITPGQKTGPVQQGMNVRFDIFESTIKNNEAGFVPDRNVTKGIKTTLKGKKCDYTKSTTTMPFPRDSCFITTGGPGCLYGTGYGRRFGSADWDRNSYFTLNHPAGRPTGWAKMTRYQTYQWENQGGGIPNKPPGENGNPTCAAAAPDRTRERRVLTIAVINCIQQSAILGGNAADVPVHQYAQVFLTEPVGNTLWSGPGWGDTTAEDIFVEMIGVVEPGEQSGVLHEYPVLYR